jgi:hypothetical protein
MDIGCYLINYCREIYGYAPLFLSLTETLENLVTIEEIYRSAGYVLPVS